MKLTGIILTISALVAVSTAAVSPLMGGEEYEFIVVFKEYLFGEQIELHLRDVSSMLGNNSTIIYRYDIGELFRGYAAKMTYEEMKRIRASPIVKYVDRSYTMEIFKKETAECKNQNNAPWGLVRTCNTNWPPNNYSYKYGSDGRGVNVFVIDTGIEISHSDFRGRALWGVDLVEPESSSYFSMDKHGHGTHMAGTIMGKTYGMAKEATAIAVKVFNGSGKGSSATVLYGINWVANNYNPRKATVVNLSLGGLGMTSIDDAIQAAVYSKGIHFAVAAGNYGQDTCDISPARVTDAVTVAASDLDDNFSDTSDYGDCVDIIAPGVNIFSDWIGGGVNALYGTSAATSHVAGAMAKILSQFPDATPAQLKEYLLSTSLKGKVKGLGGGSRQETPNRLLYHTCSA